MVFEGTEITYQEWNKRANRAAHAFRTLGIVPGNRVGLLMTNSVEYLESFFGIRGAPVSDRSGTARGRRGEIVVPFAGVASDAT